MEPEHYQRSEGHSTRLGLFRQPLVAEGVTLNGSPEGHSGLELQDGSLVWCVGSHEAVTPLR